MCKAFLFHFRLLSLNDFLSGSRNAASRCVTIMLRVKCKE